MLVKIQACLLHLISKHPVSIITINLEILFKPIFPPLTKKPYLFFVCTRSAMELFQATTFLTIILSSLVIRLSVADSPRCPAGQHVVKENCVDCPPGTYRKFPLTLNGENHIVHQVCKSCPAGTFQEHWGAVDIDLCQPCPPGTFSNLRRSLKCMPCPTDTSSGIRCSKCTTCSPGTRVRFRGNGCIPCGVSSYSDRSSNSNCRRCPPFHTSSIHSTSRDGCRPCKVGAPCFECPKNWFRPSWNSPCTRCPDGTYTVGYQAASMLDCRPCPVGTYRRGSLMPVCQRCRFGLSATGPGATSCKIHDRPCARNHFMNQNGDCERCQIGFKYIPGEASRCEPCPKQYVSIGGFSKYCAKCPRGLWKNEKRPARCHCGRGRFLSSGLCKKCPIGTFQNLPLHLKTSCMPCMNGFASTEGASGCRRCPRNTAFNIKKKECEQCPVGTMTMLRRGSRDVCVSTKTGCPFGQYRITKGIFLVFAGCKRLACAKNMPKSSIGRDCQLCEVGEVVRNISTRLETKLECTTCEWNQRSEGGTETVCRRCPWAMGRHPEFGNCTCQMKQGFGLQGGKCLKCPIGTAGTSATGRSDGENCIKCPPGEYSTRRGTNRCTRCPRWTFSSGGGSVCTPCPEGGVPDKNIGAVNCKVL